MKSEMRVTEAGDKYWFLSGTIHREDGAAVEWTDGTKRWFLFGEEVTEEEFRKHQLTKNLAGIKG